MATFGCYLALREKGKKRERIERKMEGAHFI